MSDAEFATTSFCARESGCVEIAIELDSDSVILRDPTGALVHFTVEEWRVFLLGAKKGEFDV